MARFSFLCISSKFSTKVLAVWDGSSWVVHCYDLPWTGLLTSGDNGCHQWTAMGVSSDTSGKVLMMDIRHGNICVMDIHGHTTSETVDMGMTRCGSRS